MLADNFDGKPFSRPNDVIVAKNGGIYFTEPGLTAQQAEALVKRQGGKPLAPRLPPAVYYIPPGGKAIKIDEKMIRPNGIQLSRDEKTLDVSDSNGSDVIAWDIQPDGLVRNRRSFGTLTGRSNRDNGLGGIKRAGMFGLTRDEEGLLISCLSELISWCARRARPSACTRRAAHVAEPRAARASA